MLKHWKGFTPMRRDRERGGLVIEMIVTIALIVGLGALVATGLNKMGNVSDKVVVNNNAQDAIANAIAVTTRDLSTLKSLEEAEDTSVLAVSSLGDYTKYAYVTPETANSIIGNDFKGKPYASKPEIKTPSFVEIRAFADQPNAVITILVPNIDLNQEETGLPLFTYYTKQGIYNPEVDSFSDITRIAIRLTAGVDGRERPLELVTSITLYQSVAASTGNQEEVNRPAAPLLKGRLPRPEQTATLTWDHVAGASSYTLYRDGSAIATYSDSDELKHLDPNRPWGSTQSYLVIASGTGGDSDPSNTVRLTVVPEKPAFLNVNPKGQNGPNFTVARNLTNYLMWTSRTGATGYRLFNTTSGTTQLYTGTATKSTHARTYGDVTKYTVVAFNTGEHGSGGDSISSDVVELISPPKAPTLTGTHSNGDRTLNWNAPTHTKQYSIDRTTTTPVTAALKHSIPNAATVTWKDTSAVVAVNFFYTITASNDAGNSPVSNRVQLQPNPGAVPSVTVTSNNGDRIIKRGSAANATAHYLDRTAPTPVNLSQQMSTSHTDNAQIVNNKFDYSVRGWNKTGFGPASNITVNPRPGAPTVTVVDFRTGLDGSNRVTWNKPANATRFNSQKNSAATTNRNAALTYTDTAPGFDTINNYRAQACNYTGCSAWSANVQGRQPPGKFTLVANELKQAGQTTYNNGGAHSQSRQTFQVGKSEFLFGASSGADRFVITRDGAQVLSRAGGGAGQWDWNNVPGAGTTVVVTARGNTSGLNRVATKKVVASPAQFGDTYVRFMNKGPKSNRLEGNTRWWSNTYKPTAGVARSVQSMEATTATRGFGKEPNPNDPLNKDGMGEWKTWASGNKYSGKYTTKGAASNNWKGGIQAVRTLSVNQSGFSSYDKTTPRKNNAAPGVVAEVSNEAAPGQSWITFSAMRIYLQGRIGPSCNNVNSYVKLGTETWHQLYCASTYIHTPNTGHEAVFGSNASIKKPVNTTFIP